MPTQQTVIVCNPGHGNNPYLRCVEVALALNERLRVEKREADHIVVPLLYGDRQKALLREEFGERPEIVCDEELGALIRPLLYSGRSYAEDLRHWLDGVDAASASVQRYLASAYPSILCEIARVPLVETGVHPACVTGFANLSDIFTRAAKEPAITIDRDLLGAAAKRMKHLESSYDLHLLTEPGTFPADGTDAALIPPILALKTSSVSVPEPSVYVTASGIPGMESLLGFVAGIGLPVYANDTARVAGATRASPDVITDPNIVLHVARAGWGSLWASLLSGVPMLVPPYDPSDDPEVFFNIRRMEELGLGLTYRGQQSADILAEAAVLRPRIATLKSSLLKRFGTLDGASQAAAKIMAMPGLRQ